MAYLAGGLWLIYRRVITWHTPAGLLATLVVISAFFSFDPDTATPVWVHLIAGAGIFAAFFILTDPVSGATSPKGRLWFAMGVGVLTFLIRTYGQYPDAIAFAVLLVNFAAPTIDHYTRPRIMGRETSEGLGRSLMTLRLASFGLITSLFVGVIYVITKPLILESKEEARIARLYALAEPLLSDGTIQTPISKELPNDAPTSLVRPLLVTPIVDTTGQIGAVIPFRSTEGYSGTIQLLIALDNNQRIVGLRAIDHRETPGLGDKIDTQKTDWILKFNGLSYQDLSPNEWAVKKDGGRFDSFTGATITPRAIVEALKDTLSYLNTHPELLETSQ